MMLIFLTISVPVWNYRLHLKSVNYIVTYLIPDTAANINQSMGVT